MSDVVKLETNNPSFLEGLRNYSSDRDIVVEQTSKERMEIGVTDRMRDLLTINDGLMELIKSLSDESLIEQTDDLLSSVRSQIWDEVRANIYIGIC